MFCCGFGIAVRHYGYPLWLQAYEDRCECPLPIADVWYSENGRMARVTGRCRCCGLTIKTKELVP